MEKLLNAKLKLRREEVAIRAAILRREQEQNQQKPTGEMDLVLTEPMPFEWTWNNFRTYFSVRQINLRFDFHFQKN